MAKTYWGLVNKVIEQSDIIIEVLDARFPQETRNKELEDRVAKAGKKLIFVINKTDLVGEHFLRKISAMFAGKSHTLLTVREHKGAQALRNEIKRIGKGGDVTVGICGYPNTGKSSVINALKGSHAAKTSSKSGYTTGVQRVKMSTGIYIIDSPGVIQYDESDESALVVIGALSKEHVKDPEGAALRIIRIMLDSHPQNLEKLYDLDVSNDDEQEILEEIAKKTRLLRKGEGDPIAAGKRIIADWQEGRLREK